MLARVGGWLDQYWRLATMVAWIGIAAFYLYDRSGQIHWLALGDTDDNIRFVQVKDWLAGQSWWDLRQYRLNPPAGFDIHWSRFVDVPIAALMLLLAPLVGGPTADHWAVGLAPLFPLFVLMFSVALFLRRQAPGHAWLIGLFVPLAGQIGLAMFMPLRIDHHGWQIAFLLVMLAGLADRNPARGGLIVALSCALSISIGMEMIAYLAAGGAVIALRWALEGDGGTRLRSYALTLSAGMGLCFLIFASRANQQPVCDALSPIWVAIFALVGSGMLILSLLPVRHWLARLAAGAVVGGLVGAFAYWQWPQCLSGAYHLSPELNKLWLANIREAKPLPVQSRDTILALTVMPGIGLLTSAFAAFYYRRDPVRAWAWGSAAFTTAVAVALLFWQVRTGPAAQMLAVPGVSLLIWVVLRAIFGRTRLWLRLLAIAAVAASAIGFTVYSLPNPNAKPMSERRQAIRKANAACRTLPTLQTLNQIKPSVIFTLVDLGPRLIAVTHHSAIAGPYHRNGDAILDVHHAFDGTPDNFRAIAARHHARYLLVCPNFPEGTIYQARSPKGFYARILGGDIPSWLSKVELGADDLPITLYRIDYSAPFGEKGAKHRHRFDLADPAE